MSLAGSTILRSEVLALHIKSSCAEAEPFLLRRKQITSGTAYLVPALAMAVMRFIYVSLRHWQMTMLIRLT